MNYVELLVDLPWNKFTKDKFDLKKAKQILKDSKNLFSAVKKDMESLRPHLLESGMSKKQINKSFELIHKKNRIID